ncbi:type IV pilus modification PilV family protein [Alkalicoccobacillus porphyridii]|uniref:Type II secretion system protein n=1 Tax=Alkalicoccobacillus porphyridii TaxID=2597270 RepID=A0A553ZY05_9BACI|nr:type II secretion system protein [Alkalicoccobacillus porphyridii]TSB46246.1 type II secretion system protein [Alkalicoccobacillus porphyridii]
MYHNEKGITLIELLASIVILSIFAIGFATMLMNGIKANEVNRIEMEATLVAQSEIEQMRLNQEDLFCQDSRSTKDSFEINRITSIVEEMCIVTVEVSGTQLSNEVITLHTEFNTAQTGRTP